MTTPIAAPRAAERPPYLLALLATLAVLAGYVFTLAPTVTWSSPGKVS